MAITFNAIPQTIQPCYNPIYFNVESDKTTEDSFNFVFDLYINNIFVNRDRLLPKPAAINTIYSPARILESYVSFDKNHNITGSTASSNSIDKYQVVVGEEYMNPWIFDDNNAVLSGVYTGYLLFVSTGATLNPYVAGDNIFVNQTAGYYTNQYNGSFTVLSSSTNTIIVNALHTISTPANGGTIRYQDNRKYNTLDKFSVSNPYMINSLSGWTTISNYYGSLSLVNNTMKLDITNNGIDFLYTSTATTNETLISGDTYKTEIDFSYLSNLENKPYFIQINVGGTNGTKITGSTGIYSEDIICGSGNSITVSFFFGLGEVLANNIIVLDYVTIKHIDEFSGYDFNGVLQYEEVPSWDYTIFKMDGDGKFLTNQPSSVDTKLEDRGSIGWMSIQEFSASTSYFISVITTDLNGTINPPKAFVVNEMALNGYTGDTNNLIINFGIYPHNLNAQSQITYSADTITTNTLSYTIRLYALEGITVYPLSEIKTFNIDQKCSKYEPVRFMFLNSLGQFDYFNANLLSRETVNISKTTYKKTLNYNYTVGDRGSTVLDIDGQQSYLVNSDWINEETIAWLGELFLSPEVYVINNDGSLMPVVVDNSSYEPKKRVNDGLFNQQFNYTKAIMKNTQRN